MNPQSFFHWFIRLLLALGLLACQAAPYVQETPAEQPSVQEIGAPPLRLGAERMEAYLPSLLGKKVALVVNQTSTIGATHLVDTLLAKGVSLIKIFAPEHGFRGTADAGEVIENSTDPKTGLPLVSLYGTNKKPTQKQLADIDIVVFDIQDVGARFYTYISTMHYVMEACAEQNKEMMVLDRPNPNGYFVDGPIRENKFQSFVGMHPIPVVHGLTVGELAQMINGEKWLSGGKTCALQVINCENYDHTTRYSLPIPPSPNLPNDRAIGLYPSLCLFEGTKVSVGRGTPSPFQLLGSPKHTTYEFSFTPVSSPGAKYPMFQDERCFGKDLREGEGPVGRFSVQEVIEFYNSYPEKASFFNDFFDKLVGTAKVREMIVAGKSEAEIRQTWAEGLVAYKEIRKKYLLYTDFE